MEVALFIALSWIVMWVGSSIENRVTREARKTRALIREVHGLPQIDEDVEEDAAEATKG